MCLSIISGSAPLGFHTSADGFYTSRYSSDPTRVRLPAIIVTMRVAIVEGFVWDIG